MKTANANALDVVAGILCRGDDILLARRPADKELGGFWEFPGGKHEPGEDDVTALRRELIEELGIEIVHSTPLVSVLGGTGTRPLRLTACVVWCWRGELVAREGQALIWRRPADIDESVLAPADRGILAVWRQMAVSRREPPECAP